MEDFNIDSSAEKSTKKARAKVEAFDSSVEVPEVLSCLRDEMIIVKYILKEDGIEDKKHPYYGGIAETSIRVFTVPMLKNGALKNVLTDSEKDFLEEYMGLEKNALSVYRKNDNFWVNYSVRLTKQDNILHLSDPNDYIKYKVLLANTETICPSMKDLRERPKATYQFVITSDKELFTNTKNSVSYKMNCFREFGKVENDIDILRTVVEACEGRPVSENSNIEFVRAKCVELIEVNPKRFLDTITDKLLPFKVLLTKAVSHHVVTKRGDYYYYEDEPLCLDGENPTFTYAAKYLALPKNQELKLVIESKIQK